MKVSYILASNVNDSDFCDVLIVDTFGELSSYYALAKIAFIGGSLVRHGGHNPIEAVAQECLCIAGEHTFNFEEIYTDLAKQDAYIKVSSAIVLVKVLSELLSNSAKVSSFIVNASNYLNNAAGKSSIQYLQSLKKQLTLD